MIYVVGVPDSSSLPVKIGTSKNVAARLLELQRGVSMPLAVARSIRNCAQLDVLASFPGGHELEGQVHMIFQDQRVDGEWFNLGSSDSAVQRVDAAVRQCATPTLFTVGTSRPKRNPRGSIGGGQYQAVAQRVMIAWQKWSQGGTSEELFSEFSRDHLRAVARGRGLLTQLNRVASRDQLVEAIVADLHRTTGVVSPPARDEPSPAVSSRPRRDDLNEKAAAHHERFQAWLRAGFSQDQALQLVIATLDQATGK